MVIINFSHPLTEEHLLQIQDSTQQNIDSVFNIKTQFNHNDSFPVQVANLLNSVPLQPEEWQTSTILINLPSLNYITAVLLAEIHGRMGYFPAIIRIRPVPELVPPRYEVAEIINLQLVRDKARNVR